MTASNEIHTDTVSAAFFCRDIFYIETSFNFFFFKKKYFLHYVRNENKKYLKNIHHIIGEIKELREKFNKVWAKSI